MVGSCLKDLKITRTLFLNTTSLLKQHPLRDRLAWSIWPDLCWVVRVVALVSRGVRLHQLLFDKISGGGPKNIKLLESRVLQKFQLGNSHNRDSDAELTC